MTPRPGMNDSLRKLCIGVDAPITTAVAVLTHGGHQIALIVDAADRLLGIVTDYDIRQAILKNVELTTAVGTVMQRSPIVARVGASETEVAAIIRRHKVAQLPIVDADDRVVDIHFLQEYLQMGMPNDSFAVIMAGGLGSRLRPMTASTPKPLLQVGGRPILFILLDQILAEGFQQIYVTVNYKSETIEEAIAKEEKYLDRVVIVREEKALGTAGSLSLVPQTRTTPFCLLNADLLTNVSLRAMLRYHRQESNMITVATKLEKNVIPYGVVEQDGSRIVKMSEKPSFSYFINTGVYVIDPAVLAFIPQDTHIDMTDVVEHALSDGKRVGAFPVHEYWLDIGNHEQYARAQEDYPNHFPAWSGNAQ